MLDNMVKVNKATGAVDTSMLQDAMKLITAHNAKARAAAKGASVNASATPNSFPLKVIETEASGNVTLATVAAIASTGVDFISSGSLTHSAIAMDISLKITSSKL
jgi:nicotinate-nucleotide pyrophosphorylase